MNLYRISQTANDDYDTFDSAVVAAESEEAARMTHPGGLSEVQWRADGNYSSWVTPDKVTVEFIGTTDRPAGIIVASFNAG